MIIERLQTIISHYELTPSSLADTIGVPRSSISHLLSGRNKPSLDFVLKLVKAYPEVNLYWLLNGKGQFPARQEATTNTEMAKGLVIDKEAADNSQQESKVVKKVVVLYEDDTFEIFHPK